MSTYANTGIELIGTGEQSGTWGDTTNTNLQIVDRLTSGVGTITLSGTTHTLSTTDGVLSDTQYAVLLFSGSPSGTNTVTIQPSDLQRVFFVKNTTSESVILSQGTGNNVTIAAGKSAVVYTDGTGAAANVVDVTSTINFQPLDAGLTSIAGLTTSADKMIYTTGSDTYAVTDLTSAGRAILDDADAAEQRTTLGLGTIATQASDSVTITGGSISGITEIAVADGGTGLSTVPTNGQLLIGDGSGYTLSTLTAGSGITVTNAAGSITIASTDEGGTVTSVSGAGTVNGLNLTGTVTTSGSLTLGGTLAINNDDWSGTVLSVANGGTGASSFSSNTVLIGNGSDTFNTIGPGASGNVLTSNGTTWQSVAPGTNTTFGAIGTYVFAWYNGSLEFSAGDTTLGSNLRPAAISNFSSYSSSTSIITTSNITIYGSAGTNASALTGTWRLMGEPVPTTATDRQNPHTLWVRIS